MAKRADLSLTDVERAEPRALADRCRVVLLDEQGLTCAAIGAK